MKIELKRITRNQAYTTGRLFVDGSYFCDTLECPEAGVAPDASKPVAIPYGCYRLTLDIVSPRFSRSATYKRIGARMPCVLDVIGRSGILIHPGNRVNDTSGCILVGCRTSAGSLSLYAELQKAVARGEELEFTIVGGE